MQLTGKVIIRVNGNTYASENGAKLTVPGVKRKSERHGGKTYFAEEEEAAKVECTVLHTKDTDITTFNNLVGATVEFDCDTGQNYVLRDMFNSEPPQLDGGTGKVTIVMEGDTCDLV